MSASTITKELTPIIERGRLVLRKDGFTIKDVADAVLDPVDPFVADVAQYTTPALPTPVVLTDEVKAALAKVETVFGATKVEERRPLTEDEIVALFDEQETLRVVTKVLAARDEAIKEYIRTHQDAAAEEANRAVPKPVKAANGAIIVHATPRDAHGHYLLASDGHAEITQIPGTNEVYSNEYRKGGVSVSDAVLKILHQQGTVSREDYLAMTREVRIFDETKAKAALISKPERALIIRQISERTSPSLALNIRTAK